MKSHRIRWDVTRSNWNLTKSTWYVVDVWNLEILARIWKKFVRIWNFLLEFGKCLARIWKFLLANLSTLVGSGFSNFGKGKLKQTCQSRFFELMTHCQLLKWLGWLVVESDLVGSFRWVGSLDGLDNCTHHPHSP